MPTAGKVFLVREPLDLHEAAEKLEGFRREDVREEAGVELHLVTEVSDLNLAESLLTALFTFDDVVRVFHRGGVKPVPKTHVVPMAFVEQGGRTFFVALEKKRTANRVANMVSEILFGGVGGIVEVRIPPDVLKQFHLRNPEGTKVVYFEDVDVPNVDKIALYGPDLVGTSLFEEYCKRWSLWYILFKSEKHGYVVGVVRDGSVTVFSRTDWKGYLRFVVDEVLPLIP